MSRLVGIALVLCLVAIRPARGDDIEDIHTEMATALRAQADLVPVPATLPAAATQHAAAPSAVKRGINANAHAASDEGSRVAGQAHDAAQGLAHQAQQAAASAAGQAQSQAAKQRAASHPHPTPRN